MKKEQKEYVLEQLGKIDDIGELSDGYHTFNSLYNQRLYLFAALVKAYNDKAWKTRFHEDGEPCFGGGWFLVGIDTPKGPYTYHFEDKDWDLFNCVTLDKAKPFDGHTDADVPRVMSLQIYMEKGETKSYRERYKRIGESEWFKKHYENKSIGDTEDITD